ncbi:MAG: hypothetical protein D6744_14415 [Planctomycetota bacterium]|nr:MAG: hypothetical protein D6744_14415 [Planctomycetota bacterium]
MSPVLVYRINRDQASIYVRMTSIRGGEAGYLFAFKARAKPTARLGFRCRHPFFVVGRVCA